MDVHRLPIIVITSVIVIDGRYQIRKHTKLKCYCTSLYMLCIIARDTGALIYFAVVLCSCGTKIISNIK